MDNQAPAVAPVVKKTSHKNSIPVSDTDFATLVTNVDVMFTASGYVIDAITAADFHSLAKQFNQEVQKRLLTKGDRKPITGELKMYDAEIKTAINGIKSLLAAKYGKQDAKLYYGLFAISKHGKGYQFPKDHDTRIQSFPTVKQGVTTQTLAGNTYDLTWWTDMETKYKAAVDLAYSTDVNTTSLVSDKNAIKKKLKLALNSIIHLIKANYPDTYKAKLREWGFQKEKY